MLSGHLPYAGIPDMHRNGDGSLHPWPATSPQHCSRMSTLATSHLPSHPEHLDVVAMSDVTCILSGMSFLCHRQLTDCHSPFGL